MSFETAAAERWLYETLSDDSILETWIGGRVFAGDLPQRTAYPGVLFRLERGLPDTRAVGGGRVMSRLRYSVRAIARGTDFSVLEPIARRVDTLLDGQGEAPVLDCARERPLERIETTAEGLSFAHLGGLYLLHVLFQE